MNTDVYSKVTDKIIAELEKGERPWLKPWNAEHAAGKITRPLRHNGLPYSGINILMLWGEAMEKGYSAPIWMTFKQAKELGGYVKKDEKGSLVVYANTITKTEHNDETDEDEEHKIPFMKGYTVFNVEQIDNLPAHYYATAQAPTLDPMQRIDHAEQFFRNTGAVIQHGGNQAFYRVTVRIRAKLGNKPKSYFDDTRMKPISMYGKTLASSLRMAYQSDMVLRISFRAIWSAIAVLYLTPSENTCFPTGCTPMILDPRYVDGVQAVQSRQLRYCVLCCR